MRAISTDALLLVDKPADMTSHDVVALARRALGTRRVGHAGTLDPFATGLLVLLSGKGTRLLRFIPAEPKVYEATIEFGAETETDDVTGAIVREAPLPSPDDVVRAIPTFTGDLQQLPPSYSAKHVAGERAYRIARRGETPKLAPAPVTVYRWDVLEQQPDALRARISCGTGTYIRSLARDLGRTVGSAAHLASLRRTRVGPFDVDDANSIDALRHGDVTTKTLVEALGAMPREVLDADASARVRRGQRVAATVDGSRAALLDPTGALLGVGRRDGEVWQPDVVVAVD